MGCLVELMSYVFFSQKPPRVPRSSYTVPTSSGFEISGSSSELAIEMALATGYLDFSVLYQIHDLGRSECLLSLRIMSGRDSKTSLSRASYWKISACFLLAHPTFISEVRGILRRIDSLLDALAERRAIPGSSYHARCEEIFKLHYLDDSVQDSAGG